MKIYFSIASRYRYRLPTVRKPKSDGICTLILQITALKKLGLLTLTRYVPNTGNHSTLAKIVMVLKAQA